MHAVLKGSINGAAPSFLGFLNALRNEIRRIVTFHVVRGRRLASEHACSGESRSHTTQTRSPSRSTCMSVRCPQRSHGTGLTPRFERCRPMLRYCRPLSSYSGHAQEIACGHTPRMLEAKSGPPAHDETDPDLRSLMTLGLIEPTVDADGRPAYRLSAALFSPDYTPNEALVARMVSRRQAKRRDTARSAPRRGR